MLTGYRSTGISCGKIKAFDAGLEPAMSNLANSRLDLKFNNTVLVQKSFSPLYCNFILNLYMFYKLITSPHNPANNFTLKNCFLGPVNLIRNSIKSKFNYIYRARFMEIW